MTTTTTESGFLTAIIASPQDDDLRLIYADWLEENGQEARAEFIRVQCKLAKRVPPKCSWCSASEPCASVDCPMPVDTLRHRERELFNYDNISKWFRHQAFLRNTIDSGEFNHLTDEGISAQLIRRGFVAKIHCTLADWMGEECECHGGLLESTDGDFNYCSRCHATGRVGGLGPVIVRATPIERVLLTDRKPWQYGGAHWWRWNEEGGLILNENILPSMIYLTVSGQPYNSKQAALDALSVGLIQWAQRHKP